MVTQIGIVAGEILNYLDTHKEGRLSELPSAIGKERDLILMSLGWLAREGHIRLRKEDGDYLVSLRVREQ
ncbi:MAG: winged helix-turn-helix domain-containing protein [Candidatus Omnitrophica bacterium]|nr:winged helix-turn-helix domain-containing protein [Candidatus Omnitrophota bacterium]